MPNLPTIIIAAMVVIVLFVSVRKMIKDMKSGKSCGCGCENCSRACHSMNKDNSKEPDSNISKTL